MDKIKYIFENQFDESSHKDESLFHDKVMHHLSPRRGLFMQILFNDLKLDLVLLIFVVLFLCLNIRRLLDGATILLNACHVGNFSVLFSEQHLIIFAILLGSFLLLLKPSSKGI